LEAVLMDGGLVDAQVMVLFGVGKFVSWNYLAVLLQTVTAAAVGGLIYN